MRATERAEVVEKMIRKLRAGMMPPAGAKRPDADTLAALTGALETRMDEFAAVNPNPGFRPSQRLNRAEYARAIKDLLGLDVDVTAFLPADTISHGFDNVADSQRLSPTLLEGYLRAASQISRLAVGDRTATASSTTFKTSRTASQHRHVDGTPIGTRGGMAVTHVFPADGDYTFRMMLHSGPTGQLYGGPYAGEQVEVSIDGTRVALLDINPRMDEADPAGMNLFTKPVHVSAGPHTVAAAFLNRFDGPFDDLVMPIEQPLADTNIGEVFGVTALVHLRDLAITGPHAVTGVSDTVSRRKVFACRPTTTAEERPCARTIVRGLAGQAYRGPVSDEELTGLLTFYDQGRGDGDFEAGIRTALQAVLASPRFLFRLEQAPPAARPGQTYTLAGGDIASRLSFFLWGAVPDAALVTACRCARDARRHRGRNHADARGPARRGALDPLRPPVAAPAGRGEGAARLPLRPALGHVSLGRAREGNRALLRQPRARRPQRARSAERRLHVRQRTRGETLRAAEYHWRALPPRHRPRLPPRHPRPRQRAAGDVVRRPHLAGQPRQVGDGSAARFAAAGAAAERAGARGDQRQRGSDACSRCASAWSSIAPTRPASRATA